MPHLHPLIRQSLALVVFGLGSATASLAQSSEQEQYIQIKYRTFGWGLQKTLSIGTSGEQVNVLDTQFSAQQSYTGLRLIQFYGNNSAAVDEWGAASPEVSRPSDTENQSSTAIPAPPPPLAEVTIPKGITELLFIFIPSPPGSKNPLSIIALDDSLAQTSERNVHFYNLSPVEMIVKTFDKVQKVAPRQQSLWELEADENTSSIAIAVTNPETKVVYNTRYRIRDGQRIVFFARKQPENNPDGTPKLHITSLLSSIDRR